MILSEKSKRLKKRIEKEISENKQFMKVVGAFGDVEDCEGILEKHLTPESGGTFSKFYGCDYLFKGVPMQSVVEGIGLGKSMISMIPRELVAPSLIVKTMLFLLFIFQRKKFYHFLRVYFYNQWFHSVYKINLLPERFNKVGKELHRAMDLALEKACRRIGMNSLDLLNRDFNIQTPREIYEAIAFAWEFIVLFIEYDNAYRFRLQDALENLNKENVEKNTVKEIKRLLDLLIERENPIYGGIPNKWKQIKRVIIPVLILSKTIRNLIRDFLLQLDLDMIKLDEDDFYFCLNRKGNSIRGISYEKRIEIKKEIDKQKGFSYVRVSQDAPFVIEIFDL